METATNLNNRLTAGVHTRLLAYGSSNTARRTEGMHWFDCLDLAIHQTYGRKHTCVNTGIGGDTTRELLERFDRDAAFHRPDLVIITIGGNDSNPVKDLTAAEYEQNLLELKRRFDMLGTMVVFQTYYAAREDMVEPVHFKRFHEYMEIVRTCASASGAGIVDHLARWERLRAEKNELYRSLMLDGLHVTHLGNLVLGLDLVGALGMTIGGNNTEYWREAFEIQRLMDDLSA